MNRVNAKRIGAAVLGLVAGIVTLPIAVVVWPVVFAWFLYNEEDD